MDDVRTVTHNGYTIHIHADNDPQDPREWFNLGTIIAFHRRYTLGDKHDYRTDDFSGWDDMQIQIEKDNPGAVILPVYMYDHSGVALSTRSFLGRAHHAEWDSGRVGFIIATRASIKEARGWDRLTAPRIKEIQASLIAEIETYSKYMNGEAYGFSVEDPGTDDVIESCWGYDDIDDCIEEAKSYVPALAAVPA
jgi:hypothetical protein